MVVKITEKIPMILAKNVEYTYSSGTLALKDINLSIFSVIFTTIKFYLIYLDI